jgi:hypothetical protein
MTAKQLIEKLQQFDPETRIFVAGYEGGYDDLVAVSEIKDIALDVHAEWYYGDHEDADHSYYPVKDKTIVKGIVL